MHKLFDMHIPGVPSLCFAQHGVYEPFESGLRGQGR